MSRRAPLPIAAAALSLALALAGCSAKKDTASTPISGPQFPQTGGSARPATGGQTPTTAASATPTTFKTSEQCLALYQFQQAGYNTGMAATAEARTALYAAAETAGTALNAQAPELKESTDLTLTLLKKYVDTGTALTPADQADQTKASQGLDAYWKANCL